MESAYELVPRKRPFTSGIEAVKDVLAFPFFRRDWVGVQCTACLAYALHEHLNVQDKKNEGKNRRGECSRRENRDGKSVRRILNSRC